MNKLKPESGTAEKNRFNMLKASEAFYFYMMKAYEAADTLLMLSRIEALYRNDGAA